MNEKDTVAGRLSSNEWIKAKILTDHRVRNGEGAESLYFSDVDDLKRRMKENVGMTKKHLDKLLKTGLVTFYFNEEVTVWLVAQLDIEEISDELYKDILDELREEYGDDMYFSDWVIEARPRMNELEE